MHSGLIERQRRVFQPDHLKDTCTVLARMMSRLTLSGVMEDEMVRLATDLSPITVIPPKLDAATEAWLVQKEQQWRPVINRDRAELEFQQYITEVLLASHPPEAEGLEGDWIAAHVSVMHTRIEELRSARIAQERSKDKA